MEGKMKTDEDLMLEYREGNDDVLKELFERYKKKMFNYALRLLNNQADAEDVAAEVFYILNSKRDSYQPQHKFSTWLYTVAHNLCISKLRKRKRIVFLWFKREKYANDFSQWQLADTRNSPFDLAQAQDISAVVKRAIGRLPLIQKEAIILREYQGLRYQEIAGILGCSHNKVKIILFRARQRLRKLLQPIVSEVGNV